MSIQPLLKLLGWAPTSNSSAEFGSWDTVFKVLLTPLMVASLVGTLLGTLGAHDWLCDLFSHFTVQYLIFQLAYVGIAGWRRRWWQLGICSVAVAFNLFAVLPLVTPAAAPAATGSASAAPGISVLQANVNSSNQQFGRVLQIIEHTQPDVVCIDELSPEWDNFLTGHLLQLGYRSKVAIARADNFGIGMYTRLPIRFSKIISGGDFAVPCALAAFSVGGKDVSVVAAHPLPPTSPGYAEMRNCELRGLTNLRRELPGPFILAGDLNCTPWSVWFTKLIDETKLRNAAYGAGLQPTWPAQIVPIMRIPIDHILVSDDLQVGQYKVLSACGSDHLPVFARMTVKEPNAQPQD